MNSLTPNFRLCPNEGSETVGKLFFFKFQVQLLKKTSLNWETHHVDDFLVAAILADCIIVLGPMLCGLWSSLSWRNPKMDGQPSHTIQRTSPLNILESA